MRATALTFVLALLVAVPSARGAQVEPRVKLLVRDRPSASARIVDRIPPGRKLPLLGRTADGAWAHVQGTRRDGWVPSGQLKGKIARNADDEADAGDEEERKPLASKKGVRPEAWVSSSRYHDGEDNKMTVAANKAELYGRPASGGAVLGIVRRGEVVHLVRKSQDKRWCLVDVGGGEVAWLESKYVRPGAFRAPVQADEPADPPAPVEKSRRAPVEVVEREPDPEPPAPPPPPPLSRKSKRELRAAAAAAVPADVAPQQNDTDERASRDKEEETPPGIAAAPVEKPAKKKGKKPVRLASRGGSDVGIPSSSSDPAVEKSLNVGSGSNNAFAAEVSGGIAILGTRFTSNGSGQLANYESSTSAFGIKIGVGYGRAIGKYLRLGLDGSYAFAGGAAVKYMFADGGSVQLGVQAHTLDAGVSAGVHLNVIGGLDIGLRLGMELQLNLIAPAVKAALPSDRVIGMTIGAGIAAPNLVRIAGRPLGLRIFGGGLVPADRAQTVGLEDGATSTTMGAFFGGGLSYGLFAQPPAKKYVGQLALEFNYNYGIAATHYNGTSHRNTTITAADRGSAEHLIALGLAYAY
ncbi:MAG TPA: SH3 domain-containing protein [Polyangia bacterium]|nr:SH3 domain-containing protein [Polyangia bacterium]